VYDWVKQKAVEAFRVLNEFLGDLVVGIRSLELFESPAIAGRVSSGTLTSMRRMCLSHVLLTLSKFVEFYRYYRRQIPADCLAVCKNLQKELVGRGVVEFRNKRLGHIWDSDKNRPLTSQETDAYIDSIIAGDQAAFLKWVNNPHGNRFPATIVGIVEKTRDRIREENGFSDEDIFP
jgi:hypothetical protein